jgi:hypothetical protein
MEDWLKDRIRFTARIDGQEVQVFRHGHGLGRRLATGMEGRLKDRRKV